MLAVRPFQGSPGTPAAIELCEQPEPVAGPGELLVDVRASALNRADLAQMMGLYPPPPGESAVPGLECAGEVVALGPGCERFAVGDRVMALLAGGGQGQRVAVPEGQVMPVPDEMDWFQAAAIPEVGLTAWTNLVFEGRLQRGQSVLITGAASGVGTFAVQLARELGARVMVAGRSLERLERLRELGASDLFELSPRLVDEVRRVSDGGVDLVIDLVGGPWFGPALRALRPRGLLVLVGVLAGLQSEIDLGDLLRRRLRVIGSVLRARSRAEKAGLVAAFREMALPRLEDGRLVAVVDRVVPLARIAEAYRTMAASDVLGKLVIEMPAEMPRP